MDVLSPERVADTTADPRWTAVAVTAHLATPPVAIDTHGLHLDGPLSWGAYQQYIAVHGHCALPPMTDGHAVDFDLPLAMWTAEGTWGWACSRARYTPAGYATTAARRRPAVDEMARYAPDARHHLSAGPMKARDTPLPVTLVREITWHALADPPALRALLGRVWSLGRHTRHGHGRVHAWEVVGHGDRQAWRDRVMPHPDGTVQGIRAPYHHPDRQAVAR